MHSCRGALAVRLKLLEARPCNHLEPSSGLQGSRPRLPSWTLRDPDEPPEQGNLSRPRRPSPTVRGCVPRCSARSRSSGDEGRAPARRARSNGPVLAHLDRPRQRAGARRRPDRCPSGASSRPRPRGGRSTATSRTSQGRSAPSASRAAPPGYVLHAEPDELDALRFERLLREARDSRTGATGRRARPSREALELWRGPAPRRPRVRTVARGRDRPARRAAAPGARGADRGSISPRAGTARWSASSRRSRASSRCANGCGS